MPSAQVKIADYGRIATTFGPKGLLNPRLTPSTSVDRKWVGAAPGMAGGTLPSINITIFPDGGRGEMQYHRPQCFFMKYFPGC